MFDKKETIKKSVKTVPEISAKVHEDLIVHNMPSPKQIKGADLNTRATMSLSFSGIQPIKSTNNSKSLGILIIGGGFLLICAIAYLGYKFIILPSTKATTNQSVTPPIVVKKETTTAPVVTNIETPSNQVASFDLTAVTSSPVDTIISTSSASSSDLSDNSNILNATSAPAILDSDNDGLNDDEELILGTLASASDSDNDTYSDLAEINSGYNPMGNGKLKDNKNLATYNNKELAYSLLYPKNWPQKSLNNETTVIFTAPDESLIQITVQDNPSAASILSWHEESFPGMTIAPDKMKNTDSWEGIMGDDNLNFYLTDKKRNHIYVISYIPALEKHIVYPNIFKLMIDSLVIK